MGEKLVTSLFLLTAMAMVIRNGDQVGGIIKATSAGARSLIAVLTVNSSMGGNIQM